MTVNAPTTEPADVRQIGMIGSRLLQHTAIIATPAFDAEKREWSILEVLKAANLLWPQIKRLAEQHPDLAAQAKTEVAQLQAIQRMARTA